MILSSPDEEALSKRPNVWKKFRDEQDMMDRERLTK